MAPAEPVSVPAADAAEIGLKGIYHVAIVASN